MGSWTFFASLLAINIVMHLLRLPKLILENGGGAFLILFVITIHIVALPVILAEISLMRSLKKIGFKNLLTFKKASSRSRWVLPITMSLGYLQLTMLLLLVIFLLFMVSLTVMHAVYYGRLTLGSSVLVARPDLYPPLGYSIIGVISLILLQYIVVKKYIRRFIRISTRLILPLCFAVFVVVFVKILLSITGYEGLKALFYPDFSQLNRKSLLLSVGHVLVCMFVSLNFFNSRLFIENKRDPVRVVIHGIIQSMIVALFIGVFALPMVQQTSDISFGASWIFDMLPRWLSYSHYGYYYCFLFYSSMSFILFYLSVICLRNSIFPVKSLVSTSVNFLETKIVFFCGIAVLAGTLVFYGQSLRTWWGRSLFVTMDNIYVNWMLPGLACATVWLMFNYTNKKQREELFHKQQVFFHSTYFFRVWEYVAKYVVTGVVVSAIILFLL